MKNLKLLISDQANEDLSDIWLYIATDSLQAADQFIELLYEKCQLLAESPGMGRERDELLPSLRSFPVRNYIVFYYEKSETLEIARILSGYRDPDSVF